MKIEFDTTTDGPQQFRAGAAALLMLAGDIPEFEASVPAGTVKAAPVPVKERAPKFEVPPPPPPDTVLYSTPVAPLPPAVPQPLTPPAVAGIEERNGNVVPFPPAPPFPGPPGPAPSPAPRASAPTAVTSAPATPTARPVAAAAEIDRSGLPWDARIHQKGKGQKRDGTWKLQKGLDPAFAQQVIQELSARRVASHAGYSPTADNAAQLNAVAGLMPPPPPPPKLIVSSPAPTYSDAHNPTLGYLPSDPNRPAQTVPPPPGPVPTPPPPGVPLSFAVPAPSPLPTVPVSALAPVAPPAQPAGNAAVGAVSAYKRLMDKLMAATTNGRLDPRRVQPTVQEYGAPNLNALGTSQYEALIPQIEAAFDLMIGL
jgi:hypothetical protein